MLARIGSAGRRGVAVVPVRETETWALADVDCLRGVLGTRMTAAQLGVPETARELERLSHPKAVFAESVRRARGGRRGRRRSAPASFLDLIGQQIEISRLRQLHAFDELVTDVRSALTALGYRD